MLDESFWLAVAFVIFVVLTYKPVTKLAGSALDKRSDRIKKELEVALGLKEEAQTILSEYQRNHRTASEEIEEILQHAREEAGRITKNAKDDLEKEIKRRIELAEQKIAQAEANVLKQFHDNAVDITISAAKTLIVENFSKEVAEEIISNAISSVGRKLH